MKRVWKTAAAFALALAVFAGAGDLGTVRAEGTVTVTANSVNVRESADATSGKVASVTRGQTLSVSGETTDASGMTWYQVSVNGATGYIRSDLVDSDGGAAQTPAGGATDMPAQGATVKQDNVNVRSGASTSSSKVGTATNGMAVTVVGQTTDSSGKVWYQVNFISNGSEVTGFIRSDFIELGEIIAPPEEEPEDEEPTPEEVPEPDAPTPDTDYALEYTMNPEGEYEWYLNDYTNSRRQKLNDLLSAQQQGNAGIDKLEATASRQKIIIIVLAVLVAALAVAVTVLIFKLREGAYEEDDDEDDDEDEDEEEEEPRRFTFKKRKYVRDEDDEDEDDDEEEEEEEPRPVRKPRQTRPNVSSAHSSGASGKASRERDGSVQRVSEKKDAPAPAPKKARNFLVEDDDFEFEFLNLNDKDK